jgi:hypothetical protein
VDKNLTRIVFASLEAEIYVWLGGFDLSTEPKETRLKKFETEVKKKIREVYPKATLKEMKEMVEHLKEYWTIVFYREI